MEIVNNMNPNKVTYFNIFEFLSKISLSSDVLYHMEETNKEFDTYMKRLKTYNYSDVIDIWNIDTADELVSSFAIENHYVDRIKFLNEKLTFDTFEISHDRIHELHNFVIDQKDGEKKYRDTPVKVGYKDKEGKEHVYWYGPESKDVLRFMNDYLKFYKSNNLSLINSNPFLKSALVQLLFIRIHPYTDGNGRTSRLLYNIKFTDSINKYYDMDLKVSPLNISTSILINQLTYVNILDNIYFDNEHDNNFYINKWFDFILNMSDEQLYYSKTKLKKLDDACKVMDNDREFRKMFDKLMYDLENFDRNDLEELNKYKEKKIGLLK